MNAAEIAAALGKARREGNEWRCVCPAHADNVPSLSVTEKDGKLLVVCRAGCDQGTVIAALKARGLWPEPKPRKEVSAAYDYRDEKGGLRYQVVRFVPKSFKQRRPDGRGGWIWNMQGVEPLPYRIPELVGSGESVVFVAEGEKDCIRLAAIGEAATCNHGGAEKWSPKINHYFAGLDVVILPDHDDAGRRHAESVARHLKGVAKRVRVLALPGLPDKGDVSEWLADGGTAAELHRLAEATTDWEPKEEERGEFDRDGRGAIIANSQKNIRTALTRLGVAVAYDTFARRLMIDGPDGEARRHLGDAELTMVYLLIDERCRFRPGKEFFWDVMQNEARRRAFHPVRDYLDGLRWDGVKRLDRWLPTYAGAADNEYTRAVGAITLMAAVRRVRHPGCKFDEMLVLESTQGFDKSTGLAVLAVNEDWFSDSLPLNADDKQVIEALNGRWIVEAAELKGMRKGDIEHLKAFQSRQIDRARLSYDRTVTEAPRQCIIIGTTNADVYLKDVTGNRRFWPVTIVRLMLEELRRDRDQLWAEAAAREAKGESIRLDPKLYPAAAAEQERRLVDDPWVAIIEKELGDIDTGKILAAEAWALINIPPGMRQQEHNARLGEAMRKLGWERAKMRFKGAGPKDKTFWGYAKGTAEERKVRICIDRDASGVINVWPWDEEKSDEWSKPPKPEWDF